MEILVQTLAELEAEAARFAKTLAPSPRGATLVALSGELGAGKTAFTKAVAKEYGVAESVTSPTFVLEKIYILPSSAKFRRLIHIDAYRLEGGKDLSALGFDELLKGGDNLILIEWPEKVADALPSSVARISFVVLPDGSRKLSYG